MLPGAIRPPSSRGAPVLRTCSRRYATAVAASQAVSKAATPSAAKSDRVGGAAPAAPLRYPVAMQDPDWYDPQKIEEVQWRLLGKVCLFCAEQWLHAGIEARL
jgi:hypothetical protein